jgi:hypothetical protein
MLKFILPINEESIRVVKLILDLEVLGSYL